MNECGGSRKSFFVFVFYSCFKTAGIIRVYVAVSGFGRLFLIPRSRRYHSFQASVQETETFNFFFSLNVCKCTRSAPQFVYNYFQLFFYWLRFLKNVNPKMSRIGRQKRNNDFFFLFDQMNPFGYPFSELTLKGSISLSFLQNLQSFKIQPQGLQRRP